MAGLGTCVISNVAINGTALGVALIALVDAFVRDIPTLVAKARFTAVASLVFHLTREILSEGDATPGLAYLPNILFLPAALPTQLYFSECFLNLFVDAVKLNGVSVSNRVVLYIASL